jgi:hypothetical protein
VYPSYQSALYRCAECLPKRRRARPPGALFAQVRTAKEMLTALTGRCAAEYAFNKYFKCAACGGADVVERFDPAHLPRPVRLRVLRAAGPAVLARSRTGRGR